VIKHIDCDKMADLYLSGKSIREIGMIFGVSQTPISLRLKESGVKIRNTGGIRDVTEKMNLGCDKIVDLYLSGKTAKEIGKIFGVSRDPILRQLRESGIKIRGGRETRDMFGKRFGRLVAIYPEEKRKDNGAIVWLCKCDCGNTASVTAGDLRFGRTRSCGCLRAEMTANCRGSKHPNWNPNLTEKERQKKRNYPEYREWRDAVFERDNYICQKCGERSGDLNAHHIESYDINKSLRTILENGITLCEDCHNNFHHIYGRGNNTREQFDEFLKSGGGERVKQRGIRT